MTEPPAELPPGWTREFEGKYGAEYYFESRNVVVAVTPRYDDYSGRASERTPSGYVVRIRRLYSDQLGGPVRIASADTLAEGIDVARRYMATFSKEFAGSDRPMNAVALETLADVAAYSDESLVDLIRDRTGTGLRTIAHCTPEDCSVVYGDDDPEDVRVVYEHLRDGGDAVGSVLGTGPATSAVVVTRDAIAVWLSPDAAGADHGTVLVLDPGAGESLPATVEEATRLLAGRWA